MEQRPTSDLSETFDCFQSLNRNYADFQEADSEKPSIYDNYPFEESYLAFDTRKKMIVLIRKLDDPDTKSFFQYIETYIRIHPYPGIPPIYGYYLYPQISIITSYCKNGSLRKYYKKKDEKWTPTLKSKIIFQIAATMMHLHSHKIIHKLLNPVRIWLDENYNVKITEFLISAAYSEFDIDEDQQVDDMLYHAPEIFDESATVTEKCDVYSFAFIMLSVVLGNEKFYVHKFDKEQIKEKSQNIRERPIIPDSTPRLIASMIRSCWNPNPKQRPTFAQIVRGFMDHSAPFPYTNENEYCNLIPTYFDPATIRKNDINLFLHKTKSDMLPKPSAQATSNTHPCQPSRGQSLIPTKPRDSNQSQISSMPKPPIRSKSQNEPKPQQQSQTQSQSKSQSPSSGHSNSEMVGIISFDDPSQYSQQQSTANHEDDHDSELSYNSVSPTDGNSNPILSESHSSSPSPTDGGTLNHSNTKADPKSMVLKGRLLQKRNSCKADLVNAFTCFQKASEEGDVEGKFNYAICLINGIGVNKDEALGKKLLDDLANQNNILALNAKASFIFKEAEAESEETRKQTLINEALKCYSKAIAQGSTEALIQTARIHQSLNQKEQALEFLRNAANLGNEIAANDYAMLLLDTPETFNEGIQELSMNANRGNPYSLYNLGYMLYVGDHMPVNKEKARIYFAKSAEKDYPLACCFYAKMLANGEGKPLKDGKPQKDLERAVEFYKKAIEYKVYQAYLNYAKLLQQENNSDIVQDLRQAAALLKIAADNGTERYNAIAMLRYAECLENGMGVEQDIKSAGDYYRKSFECGYEGARKKADQYPS